MMYLTWLLPVLERFPRSQRFLQGDRLQGLALDTVEGLVEATYRPQPQAELLRVNLLPEKQRLLWRVAQDADGWYHQQGQRWLQRQRDSQPLCPIADDTAS